MNCRLVTTGALGALVLMLAGCVSPRYSVTAPPAPKPVHATIAATPERHYLGVYEPDGQMTYQPFGKFAAAVGHRPDILLYYSGWYERFRAPFARMARTNGAIPCIQIQPAGVSLAAIAAGRYDVYLRSYAAQVRAYGHPVIIGFAHEMNAPWYPWGNKHTSPRTWIAAWRHIVDVFRAQGAGNVTWLWTINRYNPRITGHVRDWWPGASYVTWVGIDGYYFAPWETFKDVFQQTINDVRAFTRDPILLSETAVGPSAGTSKIPDLFAGMRRDHLLGLIWFDKAQHQGTAHQDWRLEDNPAALALFRRAVHRYGR